MPDLQSGGSRGRLRTSDFELFRKVESLLMGSRLLWFIFGAAGGAAVVVLLHRVREEQETESFEELADSLSRRLDQLEDETTPAR